MMCDPMDVLLGLTEVGTVDRWVYEETGSVGMVGMPLRVVVYVYRSI
jgi:hypothetical protein